LYTINKTADVHVYIDLHPVTRAQAVTWPHRYIFADMKQIIKDW